MCNQPPATNDDFSDPSERQGIPTEQPKDDEASATKPPVRTFGQIPDIHVPHGTQKWSSGKLIQRIDSIFERRRAIGSGQVRTSMRHSDEMVRAARRLGKCAAGACCPDSVRKPPTRKHHKAHNPGRPYLVGHRRLGLMRPVSGLVGGQLPSGRRRVCCRVRESLRLMRLALAIYR